MMTSFLDEKFWKNKKVLITGHNGFKGSWLTLWLLNLGANVWGFSLPAKKSLNLFSELNKETNENNIWENFVEKIGDISDINNISTYIKEIKPDIVFHLAAQALVRESYNSPINTWKTNVIGSLNLLESLKILNKNCSVVMVTTDKVYDNKEWFYGYRETDPIGGLDPYSSSKSAMELAISSWRKSFVGNKMHQNKYLKIASARSGNVIGGGDWSEDRIIPDLVKALSKKDLFIVRNPLSTRPWQHVLDPLHGYILLAEKLFSSELDKNGENKYCSPFNFGPAIKSNKNVQTLVEKFLEKWKGKYQIDNNENDLHEANFLYLVSDKAKNILNWNCVLDFEKSIFWTANWYKSFYEKGESFHSCLENINTFEDILKKIK